MEIPEMKISLSLKAQSCNRRSALVSSVVAFDYFNNIASSFNRIGVGVSSGFKGTFISLHTKSGTGVLSCPEVKDKDSLSSFIKSVLIEYLSGEKQYDVAQAKFEAYSDAIYTDLIYGQAVMHTNIDDKQLFSKDFALFSRQFDKKAYKKAKEILGYSPIIEFSVVGDHGREMDFISYRQKRDALAKYGYFITKTRSLEEKVDFLRKRFTTGKMTFIVGDSQTPEKEVEARLNEKNVEIIKI